MDDFQQIADLINEEKAFIKVEKEEIKNNKNKKIIKKENKEVVGYLEYSIRENEEVHIERAVVSKKHRAKGIIQSMFKEVLEETTGDVYSIGWIPKGGEWNVRKMAERFGFEKIKHIENYFGEQGIYCEECQGVCECAAGLWVLKRT